MKTPKIQVSERKLATIMTDMKEGRIRIPRFQREFVWERSRINALLDSMYAEYPIGTIFLWNAPPSYNYLLRDDAALRQAPLLNGQGYSFILDGQQRLTSLYAVIFGLTLDEENYTNFVVDLASSGDKLFLYRYQGADNKRWVSVQDVLSGSHIFMLSLPTDYQERFAQVSETLRSYPFSVVQVMDMEIDDAIEIFERINQQGRRLSRYDLICASVMSSEFDMRERTQQDILAPLESSFGIIEETSIPQALALNIKKSTEQKTQLELKSQEVADFWEGTVECFRSAVDFVRENLGVARSDFLPYPGMLPVLVHYFFELGRKSVGSVEHLRQLEHWFWRVAFGERYSGASQTRMNEDARWIRRLLQSNADCPEYPISTDARLLDARMNRTSAIRNGMLCLLNGCNPLDFRSQVKIALQGDHFSKFTLTERHHIFPAGLLKRQGIDAKRVHALANFCFIPADTNKWIGDRAPSEYMREVRNMYSKRDEFHAVMRTHLIPAENDSGIWNDDYERFLKQRASLLMREIRSRCGYRLSIQPEQRDPIVNTIEIALRDTIHDTLLANGPNYWKQSVPGDVQKRANDNLDKYLVKTPGASREQYQQARRKLDFCDVADYAKIVANKANWSLFSPVFKSKSDCQRVLDDFREYRAALKHNRDIDDMHDHRAQAAILWLRDALGVDLSEYGL